MGVGVVTKFMTFGNDALDKVRIGLSIGANDEERGSDVLGSQDVEDLWRSLRIRSIVECQCHDLGAAAIFADDVVGGNF